MQLPPDDEIVLVSGAPPIRGKKARYYSDPQFKSRIVEPPHLVADRAAPDKMQTDDWSGQVAIAAPKPKKKVFREGSEDSDSGIRREPELPEHEDIAPERTAPAREEFAGLDDEPDDDAQRTRQMQGRFKSIARQASLDPDDGIEL